VGLLLCTRRAGDINQLLQGLRVVGQQQWQHGEQQQNAGRATFTADVRR